MGSRGRRAQYPPGLCGHHPLGRPCPESSVQLLDHVHIQPHVTATEPLTQRSKEIAGLSVHISVTFPCVNNLAKEGLVDDGQPPATPDRLQEEFGGRSSCPSTCSAQGHGISSGRVRGVRQDASPWLLSSFLSSSFSFQWLPVPRHNQIGTLGPSVLLHLVPRLCSLGSLSDTLKCELGKNIAKSSLCASVVCCGPKGDAGTVQNCAFWP